MDKLRATGYYPPSEDGPYHTRCNVIVNGKLFTYGYVASYNDKGVGRRTRWNLNLCPSAFSNSPVSYYGEPGSGTKAAPELLKVYMRSISVTTAHELFHLTSDSGK